MLFSDCRKCFHDRQLWKGDILFLYKDMHHSIITVDELKSDLRAKDNVIMCLIILIVCLLIWIIASPAIRKLAKRAHELWTWLIAGEDMDLVHFDLPVLALDIMPLLRKWLLIWSLRL